jgi:hypothetical protein
MLEENKEIEPNHCPIGFTGANCDNDINECQDANPCGTGGMCSNIQGSFEYVNFIVYFYNFKGVVKAI